MNVSFAALNYRVGLKEGHVPVRVPEDQRAQLLAIKHGEMKWEEADAWRIELHKQLDTALTISSFPDRPDYTRANAYLRRVRSSMVAT